MPQLQAICHALKGLCSNVGAARIAGLAGRLEGLAQRGELTETHDTDALLWVALSEFEAALAKCFTSVD
jgi:HPt (histidine-containing phosphotransfer) domain-containing protein